MSAPGSSTAGGVGGHGTHIHTTVMPTPSSSLPLLQATPGKRIALPIRVEPKVFFANERTFLSWLNFTVLLGSLAIGLLNFGDRIGRISAGVFTFVAVVVMIYALMTFHWRADKIRKRLPGPYDDRFGPTVLCVFILAAILINFVLRFGDKKDSP
ncbi:vacuolar transporter chaperone [Gryganskiella cystojenkinii]|nr:vacuolar transporter chaperone [Gryganskiella cystojenkinii]